MMTDMEILGLSAKQLQEAQDIIRHRLDHHESLIPGELGTLSAIVQTARTLIKHVIKHAEVDKL